MNKDPYELLGVDRKASRQDIRKAYRKLAKELHPDLRPGDQASENRFKDIARAYDIIGDAEKRKKFDRGEIDETGTDRPEHQFYRQYADAGRGRRYYTFTSDGGGAEDAGDIEDLVSSLFRARGGAGAAFRMPGADVRLRLLVDFLDAARGIRKRVTMPDGKSLDMTIPEGTRDGQVLRLKGKGLPGTKDAPAGDALVEVAVRPHPFFERRGDDIVVELPITIDEAVLGAKTAVPTVSGRVTMTIPKGANSGQTLRLRGKGIRHRGKAGDQLVRLTVMLPEKPDRELEGFLREWRKAHAYAPRQSMMEKAS